MTERGMSGDLIFTKGGCNVLQIPAGKITSTLFFIINGMVNIRNRFNRLFIINYFMIPSGSKRIMRQRKAEKSLISLQ